MLSWKVKNFDCNKQAILDYDVLKYREADIKKLKKQCATKEDFAESLAREFKWRYWSRAEYEVVLQKWNNELWLKPWVGCCNPEEHRLDVSEAEFWQSFSQWDKVNWWDNEAKIDVWDQLYYRWSDFVDYLWYTRLPYERDHPKFHDR